MKPLKIKQEAKIIQLFSNLLTSGFHLGESIDFLDKSHLVSSHYTKKMQEGLVFGESFSLILKGLGFSDMITTQIALAEGYGQLEVTLGHIYSYLMSLQKVKRKLAEVATYPLVLLGFLIIIMVGLKQYLLPQMEGGNLATAIVTQLPSVLLGGAFGIFLLTIGVIWYMKRSRKIPLMTPLATIVIAGICFVGWGLCLLMFRVNTNIISDILLAVFSAAGFIIIPRWLAHHMGYAIAPLVIDKKAAGLLAIGISLFLSYVLRSKEVIYALIITTRKRYSSLVARKRH